MINLKNGEINTFAVSFPCNSELASGDSVILEFYRDINDGNVVSFSGKVSMVDCFNNTVFIQTDEITLDTGEWFVSIKITETVASFFGPEFGPEFGSILDGEEVVIIDNANIKRNASKTEQSNGVVIWED